MSMKNKILQELIELPEGRMAACLPSLSAEVQRSMALKSCAAHAVAALRAFAGVAKQRGDLVLARSSYKSALVKSKGRFGKSHATTLELLTELKDSSHTLGHDDLAARLGALHQRLSPAPVLAGSR